MLPLVSVIIPVYNVKPYLREALDSVINQTYRNLEIIIVDDGSTDGSAEICDQYQKQDSRIVVIHQTNQGLSAARNTGLDIMHGEYVAFLDSDDAYLPIFVQEMTNALKKTGSDIVICEYYIYYAIHKMEYDYSKIAFSLRNDVLSSKEALQFMLNNRINQPVWNKVYSSHLFVNTRFETGRVYEDILIIPQLFERANKVVTINRALLIYRRRPYSITVSKTEKNIEDLIYARNIKLKYIIERIPFIFSNEHRNTYCEKCFFSYINLYLDNMRTNKANSINKVLKKEINKHSKYIKHYSNKTRLLYYTFRLNPYLCLILTKIYRYMVHSIRKVRLLFQRTVCKS